MRVCLKAKCHCPFRFGSEQSRYTPWPRSGGAFSCARNTARDGVRWLVFGEARPMKRIALAVALFVSLAAPAWAGFDEGMAAYKRGDYETAIQEWKPLAKQGVADAQYNLGVMYGEGLARSIHQYS